MQVTETKNEGLKREYTVKLEARSINEKAEARLVALGSSVRLNGFRPGHVPMPVLKKRFGKEVMGEVVERSVQESSQSILRDNNLTPAMNPKIEITSYREGSDLDYRMELEVLPPVPEVDFSAIRLERLVCDVEEREVAEAVERLAERNKAFTKAKKGTKVRKGDRVLIDFVGRIDGKEFEGGAARNVPLELGSNSFIPGFEEQLEGGKEGDEVVVKVDFPANYHKVDLAGKPAEFTVHVHEVQKGEKAAADDEFAKKFGFENLQNLRDAVKAQIAGSYESSARIKIKKQLFDILDKETVFDVPQCMVDSEFASIWEKVEQAKKEGDENLNKKSEAALRTEYSKIAERRVRLGILLSDVAQRHKLQITQDELSQAIRQQAQQFPGQERAIFEFYQKNPQHLQALRGPILEEKAVNYIISQAKTTDNKVSREELMKDLEVDDMGDETEEVVKKAASS